MSYINLHLIDTFGIGLKYSMIANSDVENLHNKLRDYRSLAHSRERRASIEIDFSAKCYDLKTISSLFLLIRP